MDRTFIGLGAGGHARVVRDVIELHGDTVAGYVVAPADLDDDPEILGTDDALPDLHTSGYRYAFVALGMVRASDVRARLCNLARQAGFELPALIHPGAVVAESAHIGDGVQVLAGAIVNPGAVIGEGTIVNTGAIVEHDTTVGAHAHIAPGSVVGGDCVIGARSHIGIGATVIHGVRLGDDVTVGAGTVVIDDVPSGVTVVGVPARVISKREAPA